MRARARAPTDSRSPPVRLRPPLAPTRDARARRLPSQCKQLIERLLGCGELFEPEIDANEFFKQLKAALSVLPPVYNPINGRMTPWVDVSALQKHFRKQGGRRSSSGGECVVA